MINEENAKRYCKDNISEIYGYQDAIADKKNLWHCHHCLGLVFPKEKLIEMGLYYDQSAEMLMFVTRSQHQKLHFITNGRGVGNGVPWNKGKRGCYSDETIAKMSNSKKGRKPTKEAIEKNRNSHINNPKLSKKVGQFDLDDVLICEFPSISEAARQTGVNLSYVSSVCNGKKKQAKGFKFSFL